ncbi:hypothetical protein HDK77DRAFT_454025 [Phyllosticta capitalensis]
MPVMGTVETACHFFIAVVFTGGVSLLVLSFSFESFDACSLRHLSVDTLTRSFTRACLIEWQRPVIDRYMPTVTFPTCFLSLPWCFALIFSLSFCWSRIFLLRLVLFWGSHLPKRPTHKLFQDWQASQL